MPEPPEIHYDGDCLHCRLSPQVESFCEAHPEKDPEQCILELASVLGGVDWLGCLSARHARAPGRRVRERACRDRHASDRAYGHDAPLSIEVDGRMTRIFSRYLLVPEAGIEPARF